MEMLQAKKEQEKKRLREQMEAEAAVQRQQMENMVKARMMEVEKHRRNFMQENQVLSQRLAQMQKSNEGMEKTVESLRHTKKKETACNDFGLIPPFEFFSSPGLTLERIKSQQ